MNTRLCRQACGIMGCQFIGYHQFLTDAIVWAGKKVGDFGLRRDDFAGKWVAEGVYQIDGMWDRPDPVADSPHDAMAQLVVDYHAWLNRHQTPGQSQ